jgi:formylglycine-generating enzyme required for sulfatase activity
MAKNTPKSNQEKGKVKAEKRSRFFPVLVAGFVCLVLAVSSGYGAWYFFGKKSNGKENREKLVSWATNLSSFKKKENVAETPSPTPTVEVIQNPMNVPATPLPTPEQKIVETPTPTPFEEKTEENNEIPKGTVFVDGGIVEIGGEQQRPVKKEIVDDFYIAETEVTYSQYSEFIRETGKKSPTGWNKDKFPKGLDDFPVVGISYADANEYCHWLAKKIGYEVRLPSEPEWERAARGDTGNKYPWGNTWDKKATSSRETGGKVSKAKSHELNKSEYGVYDMVGNVWEWTDSQITEANGKVIKKDGTSARVIKGGSANDSRELISTTSTDLAAESTKSTLIGFRYVVLKGKNNPKGE